MARSIEFVSGWMPSARVNKKMHYSFLLPTELEAGSLKFTRFSRAETSVSLLALQFQPRSLVFATRREGMMDDDSASRDDNRVEKAPVPRLIERLEF